MNRRHFLFGLVPLAGMAQTPSWTTAITLNGVRQTSFDGISVRLLTTRQPLHTVQVEIRNSGGKTILLDSVELIPNAPIRPDAPERTRVLLGLLYPKVAPLLELNRPATPAKLDASLAEAATAVAPVTESADGLVLVATPTASHALCFLTGSHHMPQIRMAYDKESNQIRLSGVAVFNGLELAPGKSVLTGHLALRSDPSPFANLAALAQAMTRYRAPRRATPPIGWCSWYAIRMPISHAFAMANARVVAQHLRPLGMDLMLLDHGWQDGDICGDWVADPKDYPRGLKALSDDLKALDLKLGLWVAPSDVHATSQLFQAHPEWMLRNRDGRAEAIGRWYWEPKPERFVIDCTQPAAYDYIARTFRRLRAEGSVYFKIDFISSTGSAGLYPANRALGRGSAPLERCMQAIRDGAGLDAYIRYCQTRPLTSLGLADGVYATMDTLDAGPNTWPILAKEFKTSAGQFWLHPLYIHESCDMSIRAQGGTEEARLRVMMLLLSGSSIMFSDDLTVLPAERIRMMQQCIPGLRAPARPVNLFTASTPDIWHLHQTVAGIPNDLVGFFNFEEREREMSVTWAELGLPASYLGIAREFWTNEFLPALRGSIAVKVPARAARLVSLWKKRRGPQFLGTDLHLAQGVEALTQSPFGGTLRRAPGLTGNVYVTDAGGKLREIPVVFKGPTATFRLGQV